MTSSDAVVLAQDKSRRRGVEEGGRQDKAVGEAGGMVGEFDPAARLLAVRQETGHVTRAGGPEIKSDA